VTATIPVGAPLGVAVSPDGSKVYVTGEVVSVIAAAMNTVTATIPVGIAPTAWRCCVKKARERHAVREMKEDPSEPSCRGGRQTSMSCFGQKLR